MSSPAPGRLEGQLLRVAHALLAGGRSNRAGREAAARAESTARRVSLPLADAMAHRAAAAVALAAASRPSRRSERWPRWLAAEAIDARVDARWRARSRDALLPRQATAIGPSTQLEHAAGQLDACGALRYRSHAEHELRKLGRNPYRRTSAKDATGAGVDTLTAREAEIARLVAQRRTNPRWRASSSSA